MLSILSLTVNESIPSVITFLFAPGSSRELVEKKEKKKWTTVSHPPEILIQQVWNEAHESTFSTSTLGGFDRMICRIVLRNASSINRSYYIANV